MDSRKDKRRIGVLPLTTTGRVVAALAALSSATAVGLSTAPSAFASDSASSVVADSPARAQGANETVYPSSAAARNFNTGPAGWRGFQEYSAGAWLRGGTSPKIDNVWMPNGGKDGAGDGFLRFKGNSPAVYALPWGQGAYTAWQSPEFTYTSGDAKSWSFSMDWRSTHASYAIGWNGLQVEIRNSKDQIVRTAMPGRVSVPNKHWTHVEVPFNGGDDALKVGERYRISVVAIDYYGPSAATLGHHDIDNVSIKASTDDSPSKRGLVNCHKDYPTGEAAIKGVATMYEDDGSFCSVTEPAGDAVKPAAKLADALAKQPGISAFLTKGQGWFAVIDVAAGQAGAWAVGRESIPSSDPRRWYTWVDGGNAGEAADYAVVFAVTNAEHIVNETVNHPGGLPGAVQGVIEGQAEAAGEVLSDPVGEALDVDPSWSMANVLWHLKQLLMGPGLPDKAIPVPGEGDSDIPGLPELPVIGGGGGSGLPELPGTGTGTVPGLPELPIKPELPGTGTGQVPSLPELPKVGG
jgi:hypothetical protein